MAKMIMAAARVNCRLSQKKAAKKLGISNRTLSNWENGKSFPPADKLPAICEIYKCSPNDLIFLPVDSH